MKKTIILFVFLIIGISLQAQSFWRKLPENYFSTPSVVLKAGEVPASHAWLWRFDATFIGVEQVYDKSTKQFSSVALSGVGPSVGYKHYIPTSDTDPTPYCNFGISAGVLLGADINSWELSSAKIALMINALNWVKVGGAYTVHVPGELSHFSFILGGSIEF